LVIDRYVKTESRLCRAIRHNNLREIHPGAGGLFHESSIPMDQNRALGFCSVLFLQADRYPRRSKKP